MSRPALVAEVERFRASSAPMSRIHRAERQAETLLARAEAAEKALARVAALAEEYAERSADTEDGDRYPWGVAGDDLRAALDGPP